MVTPILQIKDSLGNWIEIPAIQGKSAYQSAVEQGFDGTEAEWLESLKGDDGTSIGIASTSESTEDGGVNKVTFTDGKTLSVKNGSKGVPGDNGSDGFAILHFRKDEINHKITDGGVYQFAQLGIESKYGNRAKIGDLIILDTLLCKVDDLTEVVAYSSCVADLKGTPGESGVYVGTDTPPEDAKVWIYPIGEGQNLSAFMSEADYQAIAQKVLESIPVYEGEVEYIE